MQRIIKMYHYYPFDPNIHNLGNTGFKGTWLTFLLANNGAKILGLSKDIPTKPSLFEILKLDKKISHKFLDIRNFAELKKAFL